ncbi:hypothetical protein ACFX2F_036036 [Malus domestica]
MGLNGESIVTAGRTSNTSLKLIRKSLPVLKVNPEEASIPKIDENAGRNSEGKRGYYVKAKVGKKVVPRVNDTTRSHLLRNQPTLSTLKARELQRSLKSKGASGPNKLVSATATSSKTEKVVTSSLPENIKHEKHEATQGELPSESNCSQSASPIISRVKSNRRRSYTSLLMTGSKLLKDRFEGGRATKY